MQRFYFILLLFPTILSAQFGCPDPMANNYDSSVTINDGSCQYPETNISPQIFVDLPSDLPECSGLVAYQNFWIGINDSGGGNDIEILDKATGAFIRSVEILNATNVDWEGLFIHDNHLFIADSGNNLGNRQDLGIYKVPLSAINENEISAEYFPYSYEDQNDFDLEPEAHPFDCEALIVDDSGIHLFTKGWDFGKIKQYHLDYAAGEIVAEAIDSFDINGLVTGASLDTDGTLGFTGIDGAAFLWMFYDYQPGQFFSGNKRKIGLGILGQNESLHFDSDGVAWISTEDTFFPGRIFSLSYNQWITTNLVVESEFTPPNFFPNPFKNSFQIALEKGQMNGFQLFNASGESIYQTNNVKDGVVEKLEFYPAGFYWIEVQTNFGIFRQLLTKI